MSWWGGLLLVLGGWTAAAVLLSLWAGPVLRHHRKDWTRPVR